MDYLYMLLSAFISATLIPLGSEALLLYNLTIELNIYYLLLCATIGNTLGSMLNYYFGCKGEIYLIKNDYISNNKILKYKYYFNKYGFVTLLFSWLPIVGDPITLIAGLLKYNIKKFIIIVLIAKFLRYLFIVLSYYYFI